MSIRCSQVFNDEQSNAPHVHAPHVQRQNLSTLSLIRIIHIMSVFEMMPVASQVTDNPNYVDPIDRHVVGTVDSTMPEPRPRPQAAARRRGLPPTRPRTQGIPYPREESSSHRGDGFITHAEPEHAQNEHQSGRHDSGDRKLMQRAQAEVRSTSHSNGASRDNGTMRRMTSCGAVGRVRSTHKAAR